MKKRDNRWSRANGRKRQIQEKPRVPCTLSSLPRQSGPSWALQQQEGLDSEASMLEEERCSPPLDEEEGIPSVESSIESSDTFSD